MAQLSVFPLGDTPRYDARARTALLIAERDDEAAVAGDALAQAGIQQRAQIRFAEAASDLSNYDGLDLILVEAAGAPEALLDCVLARVDTIARERSLPVVATVAREQIDVAAAQLQAPGTQLLCGPSAGERLSALSLAKWRDPRVMDDARRESESARLRRLNEEVARIADALARLTRGEETESRGAVKAPGNDYRGPDDTGGTPPATAQEIRTVIRSRRLRSQFFAEELFADPAWDMLLDLYAADLEQRRVSVSSLCIAAAVPPTTALRWIANLHDAGLFERQADPTDRRRAYIVLSAKGRDGMRGYFAAAKRQGLGLV